ncbi:MAG: D-2-hydroxyacid dehydrogenase [Firmicutes bacterium]|nr:D-2-hydroxyacid dehydrogenase [Bacillota bacterium]
MARKLVVSIQNIQPDQRRSIEQTARDRGWIAEFYETKEEAAAAAKDAEVVFADSPRYAQDNPGLRWICSPSAGVNHFTSREYFVNSGVMLTNSSGAYGVAISEHVIMAALNMLKCQPEYQADVASKVWKRGYTIGSLKNSRVTILGIGDIGSETARRLRAFEPSSITGVNTTGKDDSGLFDKVAAVDDLKDILPATDLLIMALPATGATYHLMDEEKLGLLPAGAIIVNVGRGSCIDEACLVEKLKAGRLRAALDVFEKEPIPADSELWDCPNLMITPHVAGDMFLPYTVQKIVDLFLEDFVRYTEGKTLLRRVDLDRGY